MRIALILILILFNQTIFAQKKVEDFGYTHHQIEFQSDTVHFISKSKKGDENVKNLNLLIFASKNKSPTSSKH